ncbi:MAG: metal-dependent transcriptional regulator [Chloroflexi bacterium]|nr:metal-dependent transcriptional regulator [Chloroflexota bacterium]
MLITQEREDYLKIIYKLQQSESPVRTNSIARAMGIEPASVTGVIKKLSEIKLLDYRPYKGVTLTPAGEKVALEVIRHHRLIELYLVEALGYSWDEVHDEAEHLEHVVSDRFEDRIAEMLGHPELDPHGEPIPTKDGVIAETSTQALSSLSAGDRAVISRVEDEDGDLLRYLAQLNLRPGASVEVLSVEPYGGSIHVRVDGKSETVGQEAADGVFVDLE